MNICTTYLQQRTCVPACLPEIDVLAPLLVAAAPAVLEAHALEVDGHGVVGVARTGGVVAQHEFAAAPDR